MEGVLEGNEGILQDRENALLSKVKEDAGEIFAEKDALLDRKPGLEAEIRELEATLAAKKDEMRQLDANSNHAYKASKRPNKSTQMSILRLIEIEHYG